MKGLLITLGVVAVAAGVVYYFREDENVKKALGTVTDTTNDLLNKLNSNWGKATREAVNAMAEQA
jgi:hypothetical protein